MSLASAQEPRQIQSYVLTGQEMGPYGSQFLCTLRGSEVWRDATVMIVCTNTEKGPLGGE